jgi:hypothetical protein
MRRMPIHGIVGLADRAQLEIVRPASQTLVQRAHHFFFGSVLPPPAGHRTDGATKSLHRFPRRLHPKIGALPPKRVALERSKGTGTFNNDEIAILNVPVPFDFFIFSRIRVNFATFFWIFLDCIRDSSPMTNAGRISHSEIPD